MGTPYTGGVMYFLDRITVRVYLSMRFIHVYIVRKYKQQQITTTM